MNCFIFIYIVLFSQNLPAEEFINLLSGKLFSDNIYVVKSLLVLLVNISPNGICINILLIDYYRNEIIDKFMEISEVFLKSGDREIRCLTLVLLSVLIRNDRIIYILYLSV